MTSTRHLTMIALGAALIATLSQISLSIGPVPFTLQTLAIGIVASLYKPREALLSTLTYLLLGAIGLPVFAGFSGGFSHLFSATSGFLWGFIAFAGITSLLTTPTSSPVRVFTANLLGDSACFLLGLTVFKLVTASSWSDSLTWTILPFILPDLVKLVLVTICHRLLQPILAKEAYFTR